MHVQFEQPLGTYRRAGPLSTFRSDVLSIEASFVLYLVAGRFKALPEFQWIPFDVTMFFFVLTFGLIIYRWGQRNLRLLPLDAPDLLMLSFCALGIISIFWSSLEPKNFDKTWRFVLASTSGYFFASILAQERERRERIVRLIIWFSCALLAYYVYFRWVVGIDMMELENTGRVRGNNYLEYGNHAAYLFFAFLALAIYGPSRWMLLAMVGAVASLFALTLIGARGPLVFSLLGIPLAGVALFMCRRKLVIGGRRLILFLVVLAVMAWVGYGALVAVKGFGGASEELYTLQRLSLQLSNEATGSLDVRAEGREIAFRRWLEQPLLGWGIGEFRLLHSVDYPHNLLLETLMEMGLAGAVLFLSVHVMALLACIRVARDPASNWIDMLIVLKFASEFLSHVTVEGYLGDNRMYFALLAMVIGLRRAIPRRATDSRAAVSVMDPPYRMRSRGTAG
ncbi:MAG TPA: O-antigen ligase family protein [Azospirillum sp.]|nr:O-antigen ligase family protein [Azospirillum sp.]